MWILGRLPITHPGANSKGNKHNAICCDNTRTVETVHASPVSQCETSARKYHVLREREWVNTQLVRQLWERILSHQLTGGKV